MPSTLRSCPPHSSHPTSRTRLRALITPLGATLLLSACAPPLSHHPPVVDPADLRAFDASRDVPGATAAHLPAPWWQLYQDPVLNQLVHDALDSNRDLAVAAARVDRARAMDAEAEAPRSPSTQTQLSVDYGQHDGDQIVASARDDHSAATRVGWSPGFALSWEVDLWGRLRDQADAAHADAQARQAAADALRVSVAADTTAAYVQACALGARIDVATRTIALADRLAELTARQQALGLVSGLSTAQARAFAEDTRATLPPLQGARRAALYGLAVLLGRPPAKIPAQAEQCRKPPNLAQPIPLGDGAALLRRRPDLREAEQELVAAEARTGAAQVALYPSIVFGASAQWLSASGDPSSVGQRYAVAWGLGPSIQWQFPNMAAHRAQLGAAHADEVAAQATFDAKILRALQETEQALTRYGAAMREEAALRVAETEHARAYALAQDALHAGTADGLDVLDAERGLVTAEAALAQAHEQLGLDQVTVFKALGGGWQH